MSREHSISLHLAKVMGLFGSANDGWSEDGRKFFDDAVKREFTPFTNRAQWADVVLWAPTESASIAMFREESVSYPSAGSSVEIRHSNNIKSRMAATLECVALATGWTE